ncbi:unnamed protein product [Lactuca saligna]|uniref:Uncharacterized protein n=1 Tax=Lactuca saligna TaxID=75948 RepID=A0AA35V0M1_LACSI|nr:unnamed protein product [Lactuca saligna]
MAVARSLGRDLTTEEWESSEFRFGFIPKHRVQIPLPDASLYSPPKGKVDIPIALFKAGLHFPTTNFFNLIIREYVFSVRELTPITINKIVGFELIHRALGRLPTVLTFKHFFNASTQSGTRTLSHQQGVLTLIHDKKSKKNCYSRVKVYVHHTPTLFGADKELADVLEKININDEDWLDCFLAAGGVSVDWRARGKIPEFFIEKEGISLAPLPPPSTSMVRIGLTASWPSVE